MKKSLLLSCALLAATSFAASADLTTGWYQISVPAESSDMSTYAGYSVVNIPAGEESYQNAKQTYALEFQSNEPTAAEGLVYVINDGSNVYMYSANGHGVANLGFSYERGFTISKSINTGSNYIYLEATTVDADANTYGLYFFPYPNGNKVAVGGSSSTTRTFVIEPVTTDEVYDIYSVNFADMVLGNYWYKDAFVTYDSENNKGIKSVYDKGWFFVEAGTTISADDITIGTYNGEEKAYATDYKVTIDAENKTITVTDCAPKLIRLKNPKTNGTTDYNPTYLASELSTNSDYSTRIGSIVDGTTDKTIFVWSENTLCGYANGNYMQMNSNHASIFSGEDLSDNSGSFVVIAPLNGSEQYYNVVYGINAAGTELFNLYTSGTEDSGFYSDRGSRWSYHSNVTNAGYYFELEYVDELTVEVAGDMVWRAPAAVSVASDDVEIYVVSVKGDEVTTTKADSEVYAAGTAFVFHGTGSVTATTNTSIGTTDYTANIGGSHARNMYSVPSDKKALKLHVEEVSAQAEESEATTPTVTFDIITEATALGAHEAVIEIDGTNLTNEDSTVALKLGGTTEVTGIFEIQANEVETVSGIYDLQGRRLAAPAKGINIINGKKVLVK